MRLSQRFQHIGGNVGAHSPWSPEPLLATLQSFISSLINDIPGMRGSNSTECVHTPPAWPYWVTVNVTVLLVSPPLPPLLSFRFFLFFLFFSPYSSSKMRRDTLWGLVWDEETVPHPSRVYSFSWNARVICSGDANMTVVSWEDRGHPRQRTFTSAVCLFRDAFFLFSFPFCSHSPCVTSY